MIIKNLTLTVMYAGFFFLVCEFFMSCIQMRSISKGVLNDQLKYHYSYFVYSKVSSGNQNKNAKIKMVSCRVYLADIRSERNRILEKIVCYSCSHQTPFKIILDYNEKGKMTGTNYFLSVTDSNYTVPISVEEKLLFLEMSKRQMPGNYADYTFISGFRMATPADSIEALPFLKDVVKGKVM
jgi:hypothetical protein